MLSLLSKLFVGDEMLLETQRMFSTNFYQNPHVLKFDLKNNTSSKKTKIENAFDLQKWIDFQKDKN